MAAIVVDASIVVTALVERSSTGDWCRRHITVNELIAPDILPAEAASGLRRYEARRLIDASFATQAHAELVGLPLEVYPYGPLAGRVWALRHNVTAYDAWYIALAEELALPLVTRDVRLAGAPGLRCEVVTPV